ncbi:MAG: chorismate synthase, partial [Alistipes sp.]|nr:chorismate synthase [Alistipes sp.]
MNQFGNSFRLSIWGESHGPAVGITIDGLKPGIALSEADFEGDLARRRGGAAGTTPRSEADQPHILSGLYEGHTTGAPLTILFTNDNTRSKDYSNLTHHFRPSHADRVAAVKYEGLNDPRGGGHFSARLTVALVAAGMVAKKLLPENLTFATRLVAVGGECNPARFEEVIRAAQAEGDSVGGVVECRIQGAPTGWGEPLFDSVESVASHLLFSIPAVKGVEFGDGFAVAERRGSENNDLIIDSEGHTATNHAGGIDGGITNGNEVVVRVAFKPTPSISREQLTFDTA